MTPALVGIAAGTALQLQQPALWPWWYYAVMMAFMSALPAWRACRAKALVVMAIAASLAFCTCGLRAIIFESQALSPSLEGRDLTITGLVAAMPQRGSGGVRFRFDVEAVEGDAIELPPSLYLGWYENDRLSAVPDLRAGERWRFNVRLKAPHGNLNPHGFDYELWLWEQGVQATGYVRAGRRDEPPQRMAVTGWHPVERARQAVRDAVYRQVEDRKAAGVIVALVVGDQNAIERADWDVFRATGVAHLMSISGLHITMFAWAAAWIVGAAWRRSGRLCLACPAQHAALIGGVGLAAAYALFSGWGVPAQRTVLMLAAVALLRLSGRRWPWPQVWLLAFAVVVVADPWALMQAGFWLSFVAVGVLFAAGPDDSGTAGGGRMQRFIGALKSAAHQQWVVTLALTPLTLLLFGQVSMVGLIANAVAIPWVTLLVTPLAMAGIAFGVSWTAAAEAVRWLAAVLQWMAALPFASVSAAAAPLWAGVAGVLGGLLLVLKLPAPIRALGLPLLLPVLLWQPVRPAHGEFELLAADVGQGTAVIVRTASHTLVYDSGPRYGPESDAGHRVLVPLLRAFDERVDTLLLSHRDLDHTGGAIAVLAMQPQARLLSSIEAEHPLQSVRHATRCTAGQQWQWDGVTFEVLHPAEDDYARAAKSNALSCVLRVANGRRAALFAGDIELAQESRLVAEGAPLRADVLLVPHHGSKTSSSDAFLAAVDPELGIVQAGYRNRFGHPARPVVDRYRDRGIALVDSPRCGAAMWRSWDSGAARCQRQLARRYWHHRVP